MMVVLRYLPRHLADHLLTRGAAMFVVGTVLLLPVLLGAEGAGVEPAAAGALLISAIGNVTLFLTLIALYGVVGRDIRMGYYRLLFCRPLSPVAYSAASFAVAVVTFYIVLLALIGLFSAVREPIWPGGAVIAGWTLEFVLLGSLVFVFSRFSRLDWIFAVFVFILGGAARDRWPPGESILGSVLNVVLPPAGGNFAGGIPVWSHIAWGLGYAGVMIALGLLAVRLIPPGEHR